jgi:hypothetical protein
MMACLPRSSSLSPNCSPCCLPCFHGLRNLGSGQDVFLPLLYFECGFGFCELRTDWLLLTLCLLLVDDLLECSGMVNRGGLWVFIGLYGWVWSGQIKDGGTWTGRNLQFQYLYHSPLSSKRLCEYG